MESAPPGNVQTKLIQNAPKIVNLNVLTVSVDDFKKKVEMILAKIVCQGFFKIYRANQFVCRATVVNFKIYQANYVVKIVE